MSLILAQQADAVFLLSIPKALILLVFTGGWAWVVSKFDKDLEALYLNRQLWNGAQVMAAVVALLLWLTMPYFFLGLLVALILTGASLVGYVMFRNNKVPAEARWRLSADMLTHRLQTAQATKAQVQAAVHLLNKDGTKRPVPSGEDKFAAAHMKLEDLLLFALPRKAERVDLGVGGSGQVAVLVSIDGVRYPQDGWDAKTVLTLIDYLKTQCNLDVEDRRKKQQGAVPMHGGAELGVHTLAVVTSGSTRELLLTIRIDPDLRAGVGLAKLGLLDAQRQALAPLIATRKGIVLVAAPAGHGLTTTLYSLLHEHDPYQYSVVTLEDEVAYEIEGVNHQVVEPGSDALVLNRRLTAIVRQDPQVVMLSRLFDAQLGKTLAPVAGESRIYVGLHDDDTFAALKTWIKACGDPKLAAAGLTAIVAQRLVRKLCPTCRTPYKPDPQAMRKLNLPPDKVQQLYKQSGQVNIKGKVQVCPACQGMGYRGRVGVFEVMALDAQARQLAGAVQLEQLRAHLRRQRMLWLQEAALARVVDGTTSIQEITRALAAKNAG